MKKTKSLYHGHRFPAIVISCAVRWYFRFSLSLRGRDAAASPPFVAPESRATPARLLAWLCQPWTNGRLLRCKGYLWAAHRHAEIGMLVQTGGRFQWGYVGRWWRFVPQSDWPRDDYRRDGVLNRWEEPVGDCRQEIVFIGQAIDCERLQHELDACLLTVEEINSGPGSWGRLPEADAFDALSAI